jgi:acyl-CoA synthetase (AMP-forming)/AMP-acid ligase II
VTPGDLVRFARDGIAAHKVPYGIEIVDDLPMLASGKPDRRSLERRAREVAGAAG